MLAFPKYYVDGGMEKIPFIIARKSMKKRGDIKELISREYYDLIRKLITMSNFLQRYFYF